MDVVELVLHAVGLLFGFRFVVQMENWLTKCIRDCCELSCRFGIVVEAMSPWENAPLYPPLLCPCAEESWVPDNFKVMLAFDLFT
jgi:hypothetical protein